MRHVKNIMFGILLHVAMDDLAITCDEVIDSDDEEIKNIPTNFNEKATSKTHNICILPAFLLVTIALLITITMYCYLVKCKAKQKDLLSIYFTNYELKEIIY